MTASSSPESGTLDPAGAVEYLRHHGRLAPDEPATATLLAGGVSGVVVAVTGRSESLVVKQALARLRVAQRWEASTERLAVEARALELVGELVPGSVPGVVAFDAAHGVLVMQHAPATWTDWKRALLAGHADPAVAARLGAIIGTVHAATGARPELLADLDGERHFEQLRLEPFHGAVAAVRPEHRTALEELTSRLGARRVALVHGDLSPKNVLTGGGDAVWLLDWEVAHRGDPTFDSAFLTSHLLLKALRRPADAHALAQCAAAFERAHAATGAGALLDEPGWLDRHVGALVLARVDGWSPVDYLSPAQREAARSIGGGLLHAHIGLAEARATIESRTP